MPRGRARSGNKKWTPRGASKVRGEELRPARQRAAGRRSSVNDFAVQGEVEAVALDLVRDAQADDRFDDGENDDGDDCVIDNDRHDTDALIDDLARVALDEAGGASVLLDREHAGQKRADHPAYAVDAEAIERIVVAEHV